jgi:hypothetical protein
MTNSSLTLLLLLGLPFNLMSFELSELYKPISLQTNEGLVTYGTTGQTTSSDMMDFGIGISKLQLNDATQIAFSFILKDSNGNVLRHGLVQRSIIPESKTDKVVWYMNDIFHVNSANVIVERSPKRIPIPIIDGKYSIGLTISFKNGNAIKEFAILELEDIPITVRNIHPK